MIAVVYGTTGELIKLAPLLRDLKQKDAQVLTLCTGQQIEQLPGMLEEFHLPEPDIWLARGSKGKDLNKPSQIPGWISHVLHQFIKARRQIRRKFGLDSTKPLLIVHGDTFTTLLGGLMGWTLRVPVAHIEAGMWSGDLRNPFPEEINRRLTARIVKLHFAPGNYPVSNLKQARFVRGDIVNTVFNTVRDSLQLVDDDRPPAVQLPSSKFGLVSLHRFELLESAFRLTGIIEILSDAARTKPLLFIDHPVTASALYKNGLDQYFHNNFIRIPRQEYLDFVPLLKRSAFVITDSGGCQQECEALQHPCIVHRATTESRDFLDNTIILSGFDLNKVRSFITKDHKHLKHSPTDKVSPTKIILKQLEIKGHL